MDPKIVQKIKPYFLAVLLQFGLVGFSTIAKSALNKGMSHYTLSVYRNAIATVIVAPFALVLERPVMDQNLYYAALKYTTPTFTVAMCNIIPALTFLLAWLLRLERVNIRKLRSQAKIVGTIVIVGGATIVTLIRGSVVGLAWTHNSQIAEKAQQDDPVRGALMVTAGCLCASIFQILQAKTLNSYPAGLSLSALICMAGALQAAALLRGKYADLWSIGWDTRLLASVYSGVICSGVNYYLQGCVMKEKGPVFVSSFIPLNMVLVAIMSSFCIVMICFQRGYLVTGAIVIIVGLYLVLWGKSKDTRTRNYLVFVRVTGAIVIIVGLYLVLWGKSKDTRTRNY